LQEAHGLGEAYPFIKGKVFLKSGIGQEKAKGTAPGMTK
jgi:hypothetical protein